MRFMCQCFFLIFRISLQLNLDGKQKVGKIGDDGFKQLFNQKQQSFYLIYGIQLFDSLSCVRQGNKDPKFPRLVSVVSTFSSKLRTSSKFCIPVNAFWKHKSIRDFISVFNVQHYVIKFVSDLRQVGVFFFFYKDKSNSAV